MKFYQEYDGPGPGDAIPYLLDLLDGATSQMERDNYCSELILLSQYMNDAGRTAFAAAVRRVRKTLGKGRPVKTRIHDGIVSQLRVGTVYGGFCGMRSKDVIKSIAAHYGLTEDAARKVYKNAESSFIALVLEWKLDKDSGKPAFKDFFSNISNATSSADAVRAITVTYGFTNSIAKNIYKQALKTYLGKSGSN